MSAREINLWAYQDGFGTLCRDARLGGSDKDNTGYPDGTTHGQGGWHVAVKYSDAHQLAGQLKTGIKMPAYFCGNWIDDCDAIQRGEIKRLAILAHGIDGEIYIDGPDKRTLSTDSISAFHDDLNDIGLFTNEGSTILFMGCLAAQGPRGTALLQALSGVWPGRKVTGFSTLGYRHGGAMYRSGEQCEEAGMRDTNSPYSMLPGQSTKEFDPYWSDFSKLPWASDTSPHAKVVRDRQVIRWPARESPIPPPAKKSLTGPGAPAAHPTRRRH